MGKTSGDDENISAFQRDFAVGKQMLARTAGNADQFHKIVSMQGGILLLRHILHEQGKLQSPPVKFVFHIITIHHLKKFSSKEIIKKYFCAVFFAFYQVFEGFRA